MNTNQLKSFRKELHAHPELSGQEEQTQKRILDFLARHCKMKGKKVGNTGVLVEFSGLEAGKTVLIRADTDALPIQEINVFSHKSTTEGVSHKCGHDGHTTILLGLAQELSENPLPSGKVLLLFQPAEENGKGAQAVLKEGSLNPFEIDYVFALHNLPEFPMHEIVVKEKEFTSNVKSVVVALNGKTAHAAEPEKGDNPANAIAHLLQYASENTNNDPASDTFFLITPIHVTMGEVAYGISAGSGEVHFTIRSWSTELMDAECKKLEQYIASLCLEENLAAEISWLEEFYANSNDTSAVEIVRKAATKNQLSINERSMPFKWGEDFGLFTQRFKGAMFGLGAGENTPALHNPDYDFPDEITPTGINMFYEIIKETLAF